VRLTKMFTREQSEVAYGVSLSNLSTTTLFLGAGASLAPPTNLPLFAHIRRAIAAALGIEPDQPLTRREQYGGSPAPGGPARTVDGRLQRLAPEALFHSLQIPGVTRLEQELSDALMRATPNGIHSIAAELARMGGLIWTTNVDDCVERAANWSVADRARFVATWPEGTEPGGESISGRRMYKVHGSVGGRLALSSELVLRPLRGPWLDQLDAAIRNRHVVLYGYAGNDVDLRSALDDLLPDAQSVTWFEVPQGPLDEFGRTRQELLTMRYPQATSAGMRVLPSDPSTSIADAFFEWAQGAGLTQGLTSAERSGLREPPHPDPVSFPSLQGKPLLRARLLSRLGLPRRARRILNRHLWSRSVAVDRMKVALWTEERWTRPLLWAMGLPWPSNLRRKWQNTHIALLLNMGKPRRALHFARAAVDRDDTAEARLRLVGAERWVSNLADVEAMAHECLTRCEGDSADSNLLATAAFEAAIVSYWRGHHTRVRAVVDRLDYDFGAHAGPRWTGWASWLRACEAIADWRPYDAIVHVRTAEDIFRGESDVLRLAVMNLLTARTAAYRLAYALSGALDDAQELARSLSELRAELRGARWPRTIRAAAEFELAETDRAQGDLTRAQRRYLTVARTDAYLYQALGRVGMGELQRDRGESPSASREALDIALTFGLDGIAGQAAITLGLAGEISEEEVAKKLDTLGLELPQRPGVPGVARWQVNAGGTSRQVWALF